MIVCISSRGTEVLADQSVNAEIEMNDVHRQQSTGQGRNPGLKSSQNQNQAAALTIPRLRYSVPRCKRTQGCQKQQHIAKHHVVKVSAKCGPTDQDQHTARSAGGDQHPERGAGDAVVQANVALERFYLAASRQGGENFNEDQCKCDQPDIGRAQFSRKINEQEKADHLLAPVSEEAPQRGRQDAPFQVHGEQLPTLQACLNQIPD